MLSPVRCMPAAHVPLARPIRTRCKGELHCPLQAVSADVHRKGIWVLHLHRPGGPGRQGAQGQLEAAGQRVCRRETRGGGVCVWRGIGGSGVGVGWVGGVGGGQARL